MKNQTRKAVLKAINELRTPTFVWDRTRPAGDRYVEVEAAPTVIERDGTIIVSAEDGALFADYYGEFRGGYPWISPALERIAQAHGLYWEWENPGAIGLYVE